MTCANWTLTITSIAIFVFAMWPDLIGATASKWVIAIAAVIILITAWTCVECKFCKKEQPKKKR